MKKTDSIG